MANPILRHAPTIPYIIGGVENQIPVNCANNQSERWNWKWLAYRIQDGPTFPPFTPVINTSDPDGTSVQDASFDIGFDLSSGWSGANMASRIVFAYQASAPFNLDISMTGSVVSTFSGGDMSISDLLFESTRLPQGATGFFHDQWTDGWNSGPTSVNRSETYTLGLPPAIVPAIVELSCFGGGAFTYDITPTTFMNVNGDLQIDITNISPI